MMASKKLSIAGWVLSGLLAAFLLFSASGKFRDFPGKAELFEKFGFSNMPMSVVGALEIICTLLFVIPQTSFLGAILLTGYLGAAALVHIRIQDPFLFPIILGVVAWIGYALRRPDVIKAAFGKAPAQA